MANYDRVGTKLSAVFPYCIGHFLTVNNCFINPRNVEKLVDDKAGAICDVGIDIEVRPREYFVNICLGL